MQVNDTGKVQCYISRLAKQIVTSAAPLNRAELVPTLGIPSPNCHP
jgi:hypothetical protein